MYVGNLYTNSGTVLYCTYAYVCTYVGSLYIVSICIVLYTTYD